MPSEEEKVEEIPARLTAHNEMGTKFFNMDGKVIPVVGGIDAVINLCMEMDPEVWDQMHK